MKDLLTWRYRYAQFLVVCMLGICLYVMTQSLSNGVDQFETNFWERSSLIALFTRVRLTLRDRVFSQAVVGDDGWLEPTTQRTLDDYQNAQPFSPKRLQENSQLLYTVLKARHTTLVIVIAPNKASIYPESVPSVIQKVSDQSRLELLTAYFRQYGPPILIDLRPALEAARQKQTIYFKTDTHWNSWGAFAAYTQIITVLSHSYPALTPYKIQDFQSVPQEPAERDISFVMGAPFILEPSVVLQAKFPLSETASSVNDDGFPTRIWTTPNQQLPTLLIYGDSFGNSMIGFLVPHFRELVFVQNSSHYSNLTSFSFLNQVQPDIVIIEFVERNLGELDDFLYHYGIQGPAK